MPAVTGEMPLGVWLRQQREAHGLARREMARRLIAVGKAAGDTSVPGIESVCYNIRRWENGGCALTERYKLYYCEVFGITAAEFGRRAPGAGHIATLNAHGLSVSLQYVSSRLVIEVSGLETPEPDARPESDARPGRGLALVTSPGPPASYGGRA
jgi:transcriptional regulator with XRE-family HTH domain